MKIIHYNIYFGCQDDPERLAALCAWLNAQQPDIVGLNELSGWNQPPGIAVHAAACGLDHATLYKTEQSSCYVGAMTREPHRVLLQEEADFHHGVLGIACEGLTILQTHLTPISAADRRAEAERLANLASNLAGPVLLMGDLNTLSPLDREYLESPAVLTKLQQSPLLARKFLTADGQPDYLPMETLLAAGLSDLGAGQQPRHSVPTPFNQDIAHALPLRLDYLLANAAFRETFPGHATVLHGPDTDSLSDHYPLVFTC